MPIIKSAKKKLRADAKKQEINKKIKTRAAKVIRELRKSRNDKDMSAAFSIIDKAAKGGVFHKKKADRLKSRLSKLVGSK